MKYSTFARWVRKHNRTRKTITGGPEPGEWHYFYNNLNQLEEFFEDEDGDETWDTGEPRTVYTYDTNGNRATSSEDGQLSRVYTYDLENRLVDLALVAQSQTYSYTYDYRTRRVVRDESPAQGEEVRVVFSGGTSVQEYDELDALQVQYIRGSESEAGRAPAAVSAAFFILYAGARRVIE